MTNLCRAWLAEKILIYTDIDVESLAVEYPDGGGVADGGVGGDGGGVTDGVGGDALRDEIDLDSDYNEDDHENDEEEDVEDVEDVENVEGEDDDDDWLNEGLEGDDFGDDIFATQNSAPQGFAPNTAPESSNAPYTAPESSNVFHADPKWAEQALEDGLVSMDESDDE